jgi:hypothetical protein
MVSSMADWHGEQYRKTSVSFGISGWIKQLGSHRNDETDGSVVAMVKQQTMNGRCLWCNEAASLRPIVA